MEHTLATHSVFNQTPPLTDYNLFTTDLGLREAVRREGAGAAVPDLAGAGAALGTEANFGHTRVSPIATPRCCIVSTFRASASTRSSSTLPGTR